jgi:hypothetical protein
MGDLARVLPAAALLALAACATEDEPVANQFEQQAAEIRNKAQALEAEVENEVSAAEARLENQVDMLMNSRDAVEAAANTQDANAAQ